jgi:hypothetical protein
MAKGLNQMGHVIGLGACMSRQKIRRDALRLFHHIRHNGRGNKGNGGIWILGWGGRGTHASDSLNKFSFF